MKQVTASLALSILSLSLLACGDDGGDDQTQTCDPTLRPVVFAHGFLAASDTWASQAQRFEANGYCTSHIVVFDWNTLSQDGAELALDLRIDAALAATGATQVDLVGHSAGGGLGYRYLADPARAAKVAHYAHVASNPAPLDGVDPGPAGPTSPTPAPVPTLNLYSAADTIVAGTDIPGATNVMLNDADHYEAATSVDAFVALWEHFHDRAPTTTTARTSTRPVLAGKALSLGENTPVAGWTVEVWPVADATGLRTGDAPAATFTVGADGAWGPFEATAGARYELFLRGPGDADRPVHYYIEPVASDDRMVYLRALPGPGSLVGVLLSNVPFDDRHVVLIAFSSSKAVVAGRNSLTVGGRTLSTAELASAERTSIAFFVFDEGTDQTSGGEASTFSAVLPAFLTAVDEYVGGDATASLALTFDGRDLAVPRWPSAADGAVVAIFR